MFDIAHVNAFMDLVSNPHKYQKYLEEMDARTIEWKNTLGAAETLTKANSKLSEAEVTLQAAKDKASEILAKAQKSKDKSDELVLKNQEVLKDLDKRASALQAKEADVQNRLKLANDLVVESRKKTEEVATEKVQLVAQRDGLNSLQAELVSRLEKIKAVMQ